LEGTLKKLLPLIALLALCLAACGGETGNATSTTPTPTKNVPTATPTATQGHHKLNETVKIFFAWNITISK
jgi:ABC-type glycerol-3-phosphate transport system substrate-binding protein